MSTDPNRRCSDPHCWQPTPITRTTKRAYQQCNGDTSARSIYAAMKAAEAEEAATETEGAIDCEDEEDIAYKEKMIAMLQMYQRRFWLTVIIGFLVVTATIVYFMV